MSSKIYVGNLPYSVTDSTLRSNFSEFGDVSTAKVMMDRDTGISKGFGFVEMKSAEGAEAAIAGLHGVSVQGRSIVVSLARPRDAEKRTPQQPQHEFRATRRSGIGYGTDGFGGSDQRSDRSA